MESAHEKQSITNAIKHKNWWKKSLENDKKQNNAYAEKLNNIAKWRQGILIPYMTVRGD